MKKIVASMLGAAAAVVMTGCATTEPTEVALAQGGKTNYTIVYKFSGDLLLDPAVRDLSATLEEITGAKSCVPFSCCRLRLPSSFWE